MAEEAKPEATSQALPWVRQLVRNGGRLVLFLDYDGTLVPIAPTPDEARPAPPLLDLLARLARVPTIRTVILSGRPLPSLQAMLTVPGLTLAGTYGVEVQLPNGDIIVRIEVQDISPALEQVKSAWADLISGSPGFLLEDKGMAVALHARFADPLEAEHVLPLARAVAKRIMADSDLRLLGGDRFLEVAPAAANKGQAVEWLLDQNAVGDALPIYFGDDDKDEEAFAVIRRRGGIPIAVGERQLSTQAVERLLSPDAVREWLQLLLKGWP